MSATKVHLSNRVIYKYQIFAGDQNIEINDKYRILSAQIQGHTMMLWAEVDLKQPVIEVQVYVARTGGQVPLGMAYIDTLQSGQFVWHVYV